MALIQNEPKKIYIWVEAQPITTPGIYHNSDLGLISLSSNGSTWITIADKNVGATNVYNSGDTLAESNCGKYYQRGNNYGFPRTGTVTTSGTAVNASTYGPNNYYNNSTFIAKAPRDSSNNDNLWGDTTNTNAARKGPCDTNFHIPSASEFDSFITLFSSLLGSSSSNFLRDYLFMPYGGYRGSTSGTTSGQGTSTYYWSTTPTSNLAYRYHMTGTSAITKQSSYKNLGALVRPFKNDVIQPREGTEWSVVYPLSWEQIKALAQSDEAACLAQLNTNPDLYFNKFNSEGKLRESQNQYYYLTDNGQQSGIVITSEGYVISYHNGTWIEDV